MFLHRNGLKVASDMLLYLDRTQNYTKNQITQLSKNLFRFSEQKLVFSSQSNLEVRWSFIKRAEGSEETWILQDGTANEHTRVQAPWEFLFLNGESTCIPNLCSNFTNSFF